MKISLSRKTLDPCQAQPCRPIKSQTASSFIYLTENLQASIYENIAYLSSCHEGSIAERNDEIKKMEDLLLERRDISAAIDCFIIFQNIDKVLEIWS